MTVLDGRLTREPAAPPRCSARSAAPPSLHFTHPRRGSRTPAMRTQPSVGCVSRSLGLAVEPRRFLSRGAGLANGDPAPRVRA